MDILISYHSKDPIYEQIVSQIKSKILRGKLKSGEVLPPIRGLAKDLGVSIITIKKAYEILQSEQLIVSSVGKGTVVNQLNYESLKGNLEKEIIGRMEEIIKYGRTNGLLAEEIKELFVRLVDGREQTKW